MPFQQELMEDIHLSDKQSWIQFNLFLKNGDYDSAKNILNSRPALVNRIFNAKRFNDQLDEAQELENNVRNGVDLNLEQKSTNFNNIISNFMKIREYQDTQTPYPKNSIISNTGEYYFVRNITPWSIPLSSTNFVFLDIKGNTGFVGTGLIYMGSYNPDTTYSVNQVVSFNAGALYISKVNNNTDMPVDSANWYLLFSLPTTKESFHIINQQVQKDYKTICGTFNCGERKVGEGNYKWTDGNDLTKGKIWFVIEGVIE